MRQTRRSRSAVTPQKDEPASQGDENKMVDKSAKANLETVFEKDNDSKDEVGAEFIDAEEVQADTEVNAVEANDATPAESTAEQNAGLSTEKPAEGAPTPKKSDSGAVELFCQLCNCSFTNYHEHMNSEGHKSKITPLKNVKTDGQAIADKNVAGQAQKRNSEQDGGPAAKRLKNQNQNPQNAASEKFYCDVCKLTLTKQMDFEFHMNGKRHLMNVNKAQGKSYCEICKLFFNTVIDLNDHTESQLHKKNAADKKQDRQPFECTVCKVTSLGQRQHEQHLASKRHKKSLEQPAGNVKDNSAPNVAPSAVNGKPDTAPAQALKKWIYFCGACRYGCNQDHVFSSHMNLAEHKAAVTEMRKKGLVLEKENAKATGAKPAAIKPAGPKPTPATNTNQNVRKFPQNNLTAAPRNNAGAMGAVNKPNFVRNANVSGQVTRVTYNIVPGPNMNANAPGAGKSGPIKKGPMGAQSGPAGGPKKNAAMNINKPNIAVNKPPVGGRPNPRFAGQPGENKFNQPMNQPMKMGLQSGGNYGSAYGAPQESNNVGGNFGSYGARPVGNYGGAMRSNSMGPTPDVRNDFRGNMRDDFRGDLRDIRDIRNVEIGVDSRADGNFRSGFYREIPAEPARDTRADYGSSFRGNDMSMDARSDLRSGVGSDMRGMVRNDMVRDLGADLRSYGSNDMRDLRSDARNDYRGSAAGYGGSAGFAQQNYRSNDDFRSDAYGRGVQASGQSTASGTYSSGMMASGRYDSYMDRNSSAYSNQYASSARGVGYIGDMALNGR